VSPRGSRGRSKGPKTSTSGGQSVAGRSFDGFRLSCFRSATTGVAGTIIWVSCGEPTDTEDLGPRLWVVVGSTLGPEGLADCASVRLSNPPEVLGELPPAVAGQAMKFVDKHRDALVRHWNGEIATREMLDDLERV